MTHDHKTAADVFQFPHDRGTVSDDFHRFLAAEISD
jgi:hypothetical protein